MQNYVNEQDYKGCKIKIVYDENSENPFENWDGIGKIVFHPKADHSCNTDISYDEAKETKFAVALSAYIHSGIALSVLSEGYRCQFDTSDYIAYWLPDQKNAPVKRTKKAREYARQACKLFNQWANGEVYGFQTQDANGNDIDSCYGFFGDINYCIKEAESSIDYFVKELENEKHNITVMS